MMLGSHTIGTEPIGSLADGIIDVTLVTPNQTAKTVRTDQTFTAAPPTR